jgi:hypothetical protein
MITKIYFHDKKDFSSRQEIFFFMKIIRQQPNGMLLTALNGMSLEHVFMVLLEARKHIRRA